LSTAAWNVHRSYLALALDEELWDALADTYTLIRSDRGTILQSLEQNAGKPMPREKREEFPTRLRSPACDPGPATGS
jgi:hypothetical protein